MTPSVPGSASATRTSGLRAPVWVTAWVAVLITGCAGLPRDLPPPRQLLEPQPAPSLSAVDWPRRNAWDEWHEPRLQALIEQALAEQPGLQQVRLRVAQADALLQGARAAGGLQLNASVDLTDQRFTENGLVPRPLAGSVQWNNNAQLSAGWEFDLFGRQEAAIAAAVGQSRAAAAQAQAAAILLAARLADGWVTLARHVEHREVTQAFIVQRRQVLELVRQRIGAGLDTNVELRQAQSQLAQAQVELEAGRGADRPYPARAGRTQRSAAPCTCRSDASTGACAGPGAARVAPCRPAWPPRRPGCAALARRGGAAGCECRPGAVLSQRQPDRVRRPVESWTGPTAAGGQPDLGRRAGGAPADPRRRALAGEPERQDCGSRRGGRGVQRGAARRPARGRRRGREPAIDRAAAARAAGGTRRPPNRPSTWHGNVTGLAWATS